MPHSDWYKPIEFKVSWDDTIPIESYLMIAYGIPVWCNRCEWIVPGTIQDD